MAEMSAADKAAIDAAPPAVEPVKLYSVAANHPLALKRTPIDWPDETAEAIKDLPKVEVDQAVLDAPPQIFVLDDTKSLSHQIACVLRHSVARNGYSRTMRALVKCRHLFGIGG